MAHQGLSRAPARRAGAVVALAGGLASALATGCAGSPDAVVAKAPAAPLEAEFPAERGALLRYRSARFRVSVPLPDGRAWKIDDHKDRALVARHAPTRSTLTLLVFTEPELVSRQKCEARAVEMGLLPLRDPRTIEDKTTVGPDAFDSRVWIALEAGPAPGRALAGHALLVGGFIHKCLFVHYATEIASERSEPTLTSRLAVARLRILGGLALEPFDEPPRARLPGE